MKRIVLLILLATTAQAAQWQHEATADLTATQVSLTGWEQGGQEAFSYTSRVKGTATAVFHCAACASGATKVEWRTAYKASFGQSSVGGSALRKVDDRVAIDTQLTWLLGSWIDPFVAASARTQMASGYRYGPKRAVSGFLDPIYLTQSAGLGVTFNDELTTRLGAALREVGTGDYTRSTDWEGGVESVTRLDWDMSERTQITGRAEVFTPLPDPVLLIQAEAGLRIKVAEYISATVSLELVKDNATSDDFQMRQTLGVGLGYRLL